MNARLKAHRITPRRQRVRAVLLGVGIAFLAWAFSIVALGVLADTGIGCTSCHAMRPYAQEQAHGQHRTLSCATCHRTEGRLSWLQDGLGIQRMGISQLVGREPVGSSVPDTNCRSCHRVILDATVVSDGLRVSHKELLDQPCAQCHGGTAHQLEERVYGVPEMEACTVCHAASTRDLTTCEFCHVSDSRRASNSDKTQWRASHGPNWKTTHGMGNLSTCIHCHEQTKCVSCHGVPVPHVPTWPKEHGAGLTARVREQCVQCHDKDWCSTCHGGVEMPHAPQFIKTHGPQAQDVGETSCFKCHTESGCEECHYRSAHPQLPGLTQQHGGS